MMHSFSCSIEHFEARHGVGSAFWPRLGGSEPASPDESRLGLAPGVPGILAGKMILFP